MEKIMLDTNILTDHLRGKPEASGFLRTLIVDGHRLFCSVITRIELMAGTRPGEEQDIECLLGIFDEVEVDRVVSAAAGSYMNQYHKSHGISIADAAIAATAKKLDAHLYTLNLKHYPMNDINVTLPY